PGHIGADGLNRPSLVVDSRFNDQGAAVSRFHEIRVDGGSWRGSAIVRGYVKCSRGGVGIDRSLVDQDETIIPPNITCTPNRVVHVGQRGGAASVAVDKSGIRAARSRRECYCTAARKSPVSNQGKMSPISRVHDVNCVTVDEGTDDIRRTVIYHRECPQVSDRPERAAVKGHGDGTCGSHRPAVCRVQSAALNDAVIRVYDD